MLLTAKKIYAFLGIVVCACIVLVSCSDSGTPGSSTEETEAYNPFEVDEKECRTEQGGISHGVIAPDPEDCAFTLEYNGMPLEMTYMLENQGGNDEWGLLIFVNGYRQEFFVNNSEESTLMYTHQFEPNERKDITVRFTPMMGKQGDTLSVSFLTMLNPSFVIAPGGEANTYGNNHLISQIPWKILMNQDSGRQAPENSTNTETIVLSEEIKARFERERADGDHYNALDESAVFEFSQYDNGSSRVEYQAGSSVCMTVNAAGQYPDFPNLKKFRLSVYVNHRIQTVFDGKEYLELEMEQGKLTRKIIDIESELVSGKDHIYLIAVPLPEPVVTVLPVIQKTESLILSVE